MQHLSWLAEKMVDISGNPKIEHTEVDQSAKTDDMLRADIKLEPEVAAEYTHAIEEIEDPDVKKLLLRIKGHETYHEEVFRDLLREEKEKPS